MNQLKSENIKLISVVFFFLSFSLLTVATGAMILWFILIGTLSTISIVKNWKNIHLKDILTATLLSLVVCFSNLFMGLFVLPTYLASLSLMKDNKNRIVLYNNNRKNELVKTIFCIFVIGGFLAIINVFLGRFQGITFNPSFKLEHLINALKAGIFEEIFFRLFLFSLCLKIGKSVPENKFQNLLSYIIMVIPHVLIHFNGSLYLKDVLVLSIFFGLPFSIMLRKVNLVSAIGAHTFVDLIRFALFGV